MASDSQNNAPAPLCSDSRSWLLFVCLLAAVTHGAFFFLHAGVTASPDEREYCALGIGLSETGHFRLPTGDIAKRMPLYPAMIAALHRWQGPDLWANSVLLVQTFLAWCTTMLLALTAERLADSRAAWLTGTIAACYAPFRELQMAFLSETLLMSLLALAVFIYVTSGITAKSSAARYATLAGVSLLLGLATLTRANVLLLLAPFAADAVGRSGRAAQRAARLGLIVLPALLCVVGWGERNRRELGSFTLSTGGGLNFYLGHNPRYAAHPGLGAGTDYGAYDVLRAGGLGEIEADRCLFRDGWDFASAHVAETFANAGRKLVVWLSPNIPQRGPLTPVLALGAVAFCGRQAWRSGRLNGPRRTVYAAVLILLPISIVCLAFAAWDTKLPLATGLYEVALGLGALLLWRGTLNARGLLLGLFATQAAVAVVFIPIVRIRWSVDGLLLIALGVGVSGLCRWLDEEAGPSSTA